MPNNMTNVNEGGIELDRAKFDSLTIVKQLDSINDELQNGKTVYKICDEIGVERSTVGERAEKIGNVYNKDFNDDNSQRIVISDNLKSNLVNLAENYEKIMEMLEWFKDDNNRHSNVIAVVDHAIKIEFPKEIVPDSRTTVRVNSLVWKDFKKFCGIHSQFTKRDLLSQALQEFMNKHK